MIGCLPIPMQVGLYAWSLCGCDDEAAPLSVWFSVVPFMPGGAKLGFTRLSAFLASIRASRGVVCLVLLGIADVTVYEW